MTPTVFIQDLISNAQKETKSENESRLRPADWMRWACNGITEAFNLDGCLRIQPGMVVLDSPFYIDPNADAGAIPSPYTLPVSLLPFQVGLEAYIRFRYHSSDPKNDEDRAEASKAYDQFLSAFGAAEKRQPAQQV